jgi:hypothetical protein
MCNCVAAVTLQAELKAVVAKAEAGAAEASLQLAVLQV